MTPRESLALYRSAHRVPASRRRRWRARAWLEVLGWLALLLAAAWLLPVALAHATQVAMSR